MNVPKQDDVWRIGERCSSWKWKSAAWKALASFQLQKTSVITSSCPSWRARRKHFHWMRRVLLMAGRHCGGWTAQIKSCAAFFFFYYHQTFCFGETMFQASRWPRTHLDLLLYKCSHMSEFWHEFTPSSNLNISTSLQQQTKKVHETKLPEKRCSTKAVICTSLFQKVHFFTLFNPKGHILEL